MKKFKFLASVLALCLCISGLSMTAFASEVTISTTDGSVIEVPALKTYEEALDLTTLDSFQMIIPAGQKEVIQEINIPCKGQFKAEITTPGSSTGAYVQLFSDEAATSNKIGSYAYLSSYDIQDDIKTSISEKGTYYLKAYTSYKEAESDIILTVTPYCYNGENKVLKHKIWTGSYLDGYNSVVYNKINITKPGYIKVEVKNPDNYSAYVTLCNSKKSALTDKTYVYSSNEYTTYYAVKKGSYYLALRGSSDYMNIRYTFVPITEKNGTSKAKAVTIKKGSTVKGLVFAEDSINKADYYKVTLTKKQKLSMTIAGKNNDSIKVQIIPANSRLILWGDTIRVYGNETKSFTSTDSLPKGTYYLKVTHDSKTKTGYYSIKFK